MKGENDMKVLRFMGVVMITGMFLCISYIGYGRNYNPETGQFLQRDPYGIFGDLFNLGNPYGFGGNNWINRVDRFGKQSREQIQEIANQMGINTGSDGITQANKKEVIMNIQSKAGIKDPDGLWGPDTGGAYKSWAQSNSVE